MPNRKNLLGFKTKPMIRKLLISFFIFQFALLVVYGQPGRELRGTWFTTAWRIDWPPLGTAQTQINSMISMFNQLEAANINAVFFQVRPFADAFYRSNYEPWSHLLGANAAARGVDPGYDPLALAIKEAHKRGMELHVWLNPYRFESTAGEFAGRPGNYAQTHPHLIINHDNRTYFNPGHPQTTQLIKNIVADIVHNYNIDGVIFDDYFYPSNMPNSLDDHTFAAFGTAAFINRYYPDITRGNFRRASVNNMIKEVNDTIKSINPALVFGVSPAGIYTTNSAVAAFYGTTLPVGITGNNNWATINCDPLAWLNEGSIDYISPQLYWQIGGSQDFVTLTQWWGLQAKRYGRHNYPSLGSYRLYSAKSVEIEGQSLAEQNAAGRLAWVQEDEVSDSEKSGWAVTEIGNQIIANRANPNNTAQGLIFYNTNSLLNPSKNLAGYLRNDLFSQKTIFPQLTWLPNPTLSAPEITRLGVVGGDDSVVAMDFNSNQKRFLVYGWTQQPTSKNTPPNFVQVAFKNQFSNVMHRNNQFFAASELARNNAIGPMSAPKQWITHNPPQVTIANGATLCNGALITWTGVPATEQYHVLFFDNQQESNIIHTVNTTLNPSLEINNINFEGQRTYFYRVASIIGTGVAYSQLNSFTAGFPRRITVNHPAQGQGMVPLSTVAQWQVMPGVSSYSLQVATNVSFEPSSIIINQTGIGQNIFSFSLPHGNTQYFLRVAGVNNCGTGNWSSTIGFTTTTVVSVVEPEISLVNVFPNPTTGTVYLPYLTVVGERTVRIFNNAGQVVLTSSFTNPDRIDQIDLKSLPTGFYFGEVKLKNGDLFMFKILKN